MRKILLILFLFNLFHVVFAQENTDISLLKAQVNGARTSIERFRTISKICTYYRDKGVFDSSYYYLQQLLDVAQKEKSDSLLIVVYNSIGNNFTATTNYPQALQYYFKALNFSESNANAAGTGMSISNIGWTYILLGNYSAAATFCKKAVQVLTDSKQGERYLVAAYDNLAIAYLELKKPDSALTYTQLSNALNLKVNNTYEQSYIYYQFARIYQMLGEIELAESYFEKSISYSTTHINPEALSTAAAHFCRMLLSQNRISEAKHYGVVGINAAITSGKKRQAIDNAEVLHKLYDMQKETDSGYFYLKLATAYRDSIFTEQKNFQLQDVIFSQQLHQKEVALEKEKEEAQRKNNLQYAAIALGVVTFVILFFMLSHSIIANQRLIKFLGILALLIVFEFLNLLLHPLLDKITNHQPVLMLLAMVCIAALLIPLHHKLEHWITHKMVEKNKKIRLAAAKKTIATLEGEQTN
jgi:tetratricopeptide (TPR) repeat protein